MGGGVKDPETLVLGAELYCEGSQGYSIYLLVADQSIKINNMPVACVKDCVKNFHISPFGVACMGGEMCNEEQDIMVLADEWENPGGQDADINGNKEITTDSFLLCKAKGYKIHPKNSGQDGHIGSQLMILAELYAEFGKEFIDFLMDPYSSIYTPDDLSSKALAFLDKAMKEFDNNSISLMSLYDKGPLGPLLLGTIGKTAPFVDVARPEGLLAGMENMITMYGNGDSEADPLIFNTKLLALMEKSSKWYAEEVKKGGIHKFTEENKALMAFLAEAVDTAAYAAVMYACATGQQRKEYNEQRQTQQRAQQEQAQQEGASAQQGQGGGRKSDSFADMMSPEEAARYNEYWEQNAPTHSTPGAKFDHYKLNGNVLEKSTVIYDDFGRQQYRIDYNNHGYPDHSKPHLHENTWLPGRGPDQHSSNRYDWWR